MPTKIVSPKDPAEAVPVTFDFNPILAGESITGTPTCSVTVDAGEDASPSSMLSGGASAQSGYVTQKIQGGVAGNDYRVKCIATTATRTLVLALIVPVRLA